MANLQGVYTLSIWRTALAPELATDLLGHHFQSPLLNASGVHCTRVEELEALRASEAGSLITKSATLQPRAGNPEPRYCATALGSINAMGLPNAGYRYYLDYARSYPHADKPLWLSVAGLTLDENIAIFKAIAHADLPVLVELNLSCPNVPNKPQIAYDFSAMETIIAALSAVYRRPFGVKLPPYFDMAHFDAAAALLNRYSNIAFITCINSIGNGLVIDLDKESVVIKPKDGFGGLGGDYVLPTALANVNAFYRRCPSKQIIGCGGVRTGEHVMMHLLAGASLVQVGTALYAQGPSLFSHLNHALRTLLAQKGYATVAAVRGRLKTL